MAERRLATEMGPTPAELAQQFQQRYGAVETVGWRPRMDWRVGYFSPDEYYEATVAKLVAADTDWLDVGCGRDLFPTNTPLAEELSKRCRLLVGLDPDSTLDENPYVHEKVRGTPDTYHPDRTFSLITLRMVAEHIPDPQACVRRLAALTRPGGVVVIYTINRWSPLPILTKLIPFALHHPIKKFLWKTEEKDTFPVVYRMNTRRTLRDLLDSAGFDERSFTHLSDCRTLHRFKVGHVAELALWRVLRLLGLQYPEQCLLGVYVRR
jgi:SAM-dependent methyltransferase